MHPDHPIYAQTLSVCPSSVCLCVCTSVIIVVTIAIATHRIDIVQIPQPGGRRHQRTAGRKTSDRHARPVCDATAARPSCHPVGRCRQCVRHQCVHLDGPFDDTASWWQRLLRRRRRSRRLSLVVAFRRHRHRFAAVDNARHAIAHWQPGAVRPSHAHDAADAQHAAGPTGQQLCQCDDNEHDAAAALVGTVASCIVTGHRCWRRWRRWHRRIPDALRRRVSQLTEAALVAENEAEVVYLERTRCELI